MLDWISLDRQVAGRDVQVLDQFGQQSQILVVIRHDELIGAVVGLDRALVREQTADTVAQIGGLNVG